MCCHWRLIKKLHEKSAELEAAYNKINQVYSSGAVEGYTSEHFGSCLPSIAICAQGRGKAAGLLQGDRQSVLSSEQGLTFPFWPMWHYKLYDFEVEWTCPRCSDLAALETRTRSIPIPKAAPKAKGKGKGKGKGSEKEGEEEVPAAGAKAKAKAKSVQKRK